MRLLRFAVMGLLLAGCSPHPAAKSTEASGESVFSLPILRDVPRACIPIKGEIHYFDSRPRRYKEMWLSGELDQGRFDEIISDVSVLVRGVKVTPRSVFDIQYRFGAEMERAGFPFEIDYDTTYLGAVYFVSGRKMDILQDGTNALMYVQWRAEQ